MAGQDGDRTLAQQLVGLEHIPWAGKTVLDLGAAEGCISKHAAQSGATGVTGVEIVNAHVARAIKECESYPCVFECADLNTWDTDQQFDIVLLLALLHKLRNPVEAMRRFARCAKEMIVLRLPPKKAPWIIIDPRSGSRAQNVGAVLFNSGWELQSKKDGTFNEAVLTYVRA